jgi:hypothetical protein
MPAGWDNLPDDVKERILAMTVTTTLQGVSVPSMAQAAATATVSRSFARTTRSVVSLVKQSYVPLVRLMRSATDVALGELLQVLTASGAPEYERCSQLLFRLSLSVNDPDLKSCVKNLSHSLGSRQGRVAPEDMQGLLQFAMLCMKNPKTLNNAKWGVTEMDVIGLRELISEIVQRFPPQTHLCVALGASADPVAIGLKMQGYTVVYLPISGVEDTNQFRSSHIGYVTQQVRTWPLHKSLLVIDAMSSGTSLRVMKSLINVACKQLQRPVPNITLFALNPPQDDKEEAKSLVHRGDVQTSHGTSEAIRHVQFRIYKQEYKEDDLGRLYPKNHTGGPANAAAMMRMVAALLAGRTAV